jgi:hypothetical protein
LATKVDVSGKNERSGAQQMTGTLKYMAIEVLELAFRDAQRDLTHTYRHDLESFFYAFLDICINYGGRDGTQQGEDALGAWYIGSYEDIAFNKRGRMGVSGFRNFLVKFSSIFDPLKDLARDLRNVLFQQGDICTGTPEDPLSLYNPMIEAFDNALFTLVN